MSKSPRYRVTHYLDYEVLDYGKPLPNGLREHTDSPRLVARFRDDWVAANALAAKGNELHQ